MSFRRDSEKAKAWRKRLDNFPELLEKVGLPVVVLNDDHAWRFFLQEGFFVWGEDSRLIDVMSFLAGAQLAALYELLSKLLTEQERSGPGLWTMLDKRFCKPR